MTTRALVLAHVYLAAIVAANLTIAALGAAWVIPVGLVLVGLDLAIRDRLHDELEQTTRPQLVAIMGLLIAIGGLVSYLLNADAGRVAIASAAAFTAAAVVDAVGYQLLEGRRPWVRSAVSSAPAAVVDSAVFLVILTAGVPVLLIVAQAAAKALGALVWALVLYRRRA